MMVYFEGGLRNNHIEEISEYLYSLPYIKLHPPWWVSSKTHDYVEYEEYERERRKRHLCHAGYIPIYKYKGMKTREAETDELKKFFTELAEYEDACGLGYE